MTPTTRKSFKDLTKGAWAATAGHRVRFFAFVVVFVAAYTLDLAVPWSIGYTLSVFVKRGLTKAAFYQGLWGIGFYTVLRFGNIVLHHLGRYLQSTVTYSARMNTLTQIFGAMISYPLRWHIERHSGENLSKLHRSAGAVEAVIGTYVWQIIEGVVKVVFAGVAIFALDFWVAVTVLGIALLTIALMILFNRLVTKRIRQNNAFYNKINRICVDYLFNIVTVKTLGLEPAAKRYLQETRAEGYTLAKKISKYMELKWAQTGIGNALVIAITLIIYFYRRIGTHEVFDVGQVYVLLNYLDRIFQAIGSFTGYYSGMVESATAYEDAMDILSYQKAQPDHAVLPAFDTSWQTLQVQNLNFSYVQGERIGLRDAEFTIKKGEKIALVGPSGGGKSTFLKLFAGLLTPESYTISTDQQVTVNIEAIVQSTLLIPQEPEIFSETVHYNLTMGEEFDQKELSFFVSLCKLDVLLGKLPNGWNSSLAEKGLNLSVGEKQRVALARGLLRGARKTFLLLDEPTSSLDPKTEKEIFHGILYHFQDRTLLSAVHRLNLVPMFDKIVLVSQGAVLEVGTFAELLERKGQFYKAWEDYQAKVAKEQPGPKEVPPVEPPATEKNGEEAEE